MGKYISEVDVFPLKDFYLYLFVSASIITLAVLGYPVYFKSDDIVSLTWVKSHPNFIDCFIPGRNYLFAGHRPVALFYWWIAFNFFGMGQTFYHIVMPTLLILSIIFLHKLAKILFGGRVGFFTVLVFFLVFNRYFNVLFWYSRNGYLTESCFALMGCYFIARAFYTNGFIPKLLAFFFSAGAIFSREPSMGIISAFALGLLLNLRPKFQEWRRYLFLVPIFIVVLYQFFVTPCWSVRFASSEQASFQGLMNNYSFYANDLIRGISGFILLLLFFYLLMTTINSHLSVHRRTAWLPPIFFISVSILLSLIDPVLFHLPFFLGLLVFLVVALFWEQNYLPLISWFAVSFFANLVLKVPHHIHLFTTTFGLAVLIGLSAERAYRDMRHWLPQLLKSRKALTTGLVSTAIAGTILMGDQTVYQYKVLTALKNTTQNFRDVTEFIVNYFPPHSELFVLDSYSLGRQYHREIERPRLGKTIWIKQMQPFLDLCGRPDIKVRALREIIDGFKHSSYILAENVRENKFSKHLLKENSIEAELVFKVGRGVDSAYVYELTSPLKASRKFPPLQIDITGL